MSNSINVVNQGHMYVHRGGNGRAGDDRRINIVNEHGAQLFLFGNEASVLQQSSMRDASIQIPGRMQLEDKKVQVVDLCKPSVVRIRAHSGEGSGSVWDTEGHVITNNHVADGNDLKVTLSDGSSCKADVVGRSRSQDFALIKLRGCDPAKLKPVELSSKELRNRDRVFTIGFPLHCDMTVTNGFISCFPKDPICTSPETKIRDAIQLDANLNPGNSGGPLYDSTGRFIGVVVSCFLNSGIGYAIPLKTVTELVDRFIQTDMEAKHLEVMESLSLITPLRHTYGMPSGRISEASSSTRYDLSTPRTAPVKSTPRRTPPVISTPRRTPPVISTPRRTPPVISTLRRTPPARPELVSYSSIEHLSVEVSNSTTQVQYSKQEYSRYQYN